MAWTLDEAMAAFEGFGKPGTIATNQNNPGNLSCGPWSEQHGATGCGTGNIATFPDVPTGSKAMSDLIGVYAGSGYTLSEMIGKWSPASGAGNSPESTQNYIDFVSGKLGVDPNVKVSDISGGQGFWTKLGCMIAVTDEAKKFCESGQSAAGFGDSTPSKCGSLDFACKVGEMFSGFSFGRIGAFVLGLILIAGGLYLFKPEISIGG
jgi:hypothetical protein